MYWGVVGMHREGKRRKTSRRKEISLFYRRGVIFLPSKQNSNQKVVSLNPTRDSLHRRARDRQDETESWEDKMKGTDGEEEGGQKRKEEWEEMRQKCCIINCSEMS